MRMLLAARLPNDTFNATIELHPVMDRQDLQEAGLGKLGENWALPLAVGCGERSEPHWLES